MRTIIKNPRAAFLLVLAPLLALLLASSKDPHGERDAHVAAPKQQGGGHGVHWGYSGPVGPEHWGDLAHDYATCKTGREQSPIDIPSSATIDRGSLAFHYEESILDLINNGHTVQANYRSGTKDTGDTVKIGGETYAIRAGGGTPSYLSANGKRYELLQFHFHAPSEHWVAGEPYPLEAHLVHKSASGELAVVGVLFQEARANRFLEGIWNFLPARAGATLVRDSARINVLDLLPASRAHYNYRGSLTTPPCSEGVNWFVLETPVAVSASQVRKFRNIIGDNARPVQEPFDRRMGRTH